MSGAVEVLDRLVQEFLANGSIRPVEVQLDEHALRLLVRFNGNPIRFLPKMFEGDWELLGVRPRLGPARVLRAVKDAHEIPRVIVRQGPGLFIYTGAPSEHGLT